MQLLIRVLTGKIYVPRGTRESVTGINSLELIAVAVRSVAYRREVETFNGGD